MFFTRLPLWKIVQVPQEYFTRVVDLWPLIGWLTGGAVAATLYGASFVLPMWCAVVLAFLMRILITGALHEDGLADFCDGFGGGTTREKILVIMKDSHIGTYGVLGLIFYFMLLVGLISSMPVKTACLLIFAGDTWSKFCASHVINILPYARNVEEAKNKVIYKKEHFLNIFMSLIIGALPALLLPSWSYLIAYIFPAVTTLMLILLYKKKIGGYTGDCCGAAFLLSELSFYIACTVICGLI